MSDLAGIGLRKAKGDLQLNLARDMKGSKKGFYKYIKSKKKTKESMGLILNVAGDLVKNDMEKAKVLNSFYSKCS